MKKRTILFMMVLFALSLVAGACAPQPASEEQDTAGTQPLQVTVSILPQAYFVQRIAGDLVAVNVMVGPGDDAHTYEPKPEQMVALSESVLFFSIGIEYEEAWLPRFEDTNPDMDIIDTAEGIMRIMETVPHDHEDDDHAHEADDHHDDDDYAHEADDHHVDDDHTHEADDYHDNDHGDDHGHGFGLDPHVWLSPANGVTIATNIYNALVAVSPENEAVFTANYEALVAEIEALDARITETLSTLTRRNFMVYHPAWGYFANAYGLTQLTIQVGGTDPSARELAALIDQALEEEISVVFVQPQFSEANAQAIAQEIGGGVVKVDPLAYDWLANLELVADAFASALGN
jgi:zinc transport system substrate-binding protein